MDIETLAAEAYDVMNDAAYRYEIRHLHGIEVAPGFFNVFNTITGQNKPVVLHEETSLIFKVGHNHPNFQNASNRSFGFVEWPEGRFEVRLPYTEFFSFHGDYGVIAQEYVIGEPCPHIEWGNGEPCYHRPDLTTVTPFRDMHPGNWKFSKDAVVIFDFDL